MHFCECKLFVGPDSLHLILDTWQRSLIIWNSFCPCRKVLSSVVCNRRSLRSVSCLQMGEWNNLSSCNLLSRLLPNMFFCCSGPIKTKRYEMKILFGKCNNSDSKECAHTMFYSITPISLTRSQREVNNPSEAVFSKKANPFSVLFLYICIYIEFSFFFFFSRLGAQSHFHILEVISSC